MILMYHNIDIEVGFNTISVRNFEEQMAYLKSRKDLKIVSLDYYVANLKNQKQQKLVTITFDDAYLSIKSNVLPVISKYGIPVSVFIPVGLVGKHNTWDTKNGYDKLDILSWSEIISLNNEQLITFGSHGINHISLGSVDNETLHNEIVNSKTILENATGSVVNYFSFPFGQLKDIGKNSAKILTGNGYVAALSTNWSRKNNQNDQYSLHRIEIQSNTSITMFQAIINRRLDLKYRKQQLKNTLYKLGIVR